MPAMSETLQDAFNDQLRNEHHASYVYLSMAAWAEDRDYPGMSRWMEMQSEEEKEHAMRFYEHLTDRDARVRLQAIDAPEHEWADPVGLFQAALDHERKVTGQIHELVDLARKEGDHAAESFLQWFVDEQVEEERTLQDIVARLRMADDDSAALLQIDTDLGSRTQTEL